MSQVTERKASLLKPASTRRPRVNRHRAPGSRLRMMPWVQARGHAPGRCTPFRIVRYRLTCRISASRARQYSWYSMLMSVHMTEPLSNERSGTLSRASFRPASRAAENGFLGARICFVVFPVSVI